MKLLFCDTFSQDPPDGSVNSSWSAIEFQSPVVLEEIQVIPRGNQLYEQLGAEGQCGKTAPGHFRIDFFACDVKNEKDASTFENLCALEYNEASRQTVAFPRLPFVTTQLLCSGWYTSVTLAVFGAEASDENAVRLIHERRNKESRPLLPTPTDTLQIPFSETESRAFTTPQLNPPHQTGPVSQNKVPFHGFNSDKDNTNLVFRSNEQNKFQNSNFNTRPYHGRQNDNFQYRNNQQRETFYKYPLLQTPSLGSNEQFSDRVTGRYQHLKYSTNQKNGNFQNQDFEWENEASCSNMQENDNFSGQKKDEQFEENQKRQQDEDNWEDAVYEEINDDELDEEAAASFEAMVADDLLMPSSMMSFNPFHMEAYPLSFYSSPESTDYEIMRNRLQDMHHEDIESSKKKTSDIMVDDANKLKKLISAALDLCPVKLEDGNLQIKSEFISVFPGKESDWVAKLEQIVLLINSSLPYLEVKSESDYIFILSFWAVTALQLDGPVAKLIGVNVRALKVGLRLALNLCHAASDVAEQLTNVHLSECLLEILSSKHIASTIKILAIHVLDALTNWPLQMHEFLFGDEFSESASASKYGKTKYAQIIEIALEPQTSRVAYGLSQLIRKAHIYECMHEIHALTLSLVTEKMPDEYSYVSDDNSNDDDEEEDYGNDEDVEMVVMSSVSSDVEEEQTTLPLCDNSDIDGRMMPSKTKRKVAATESLDERNLHTEESVDHGLSQCNASHISDDLLIPMESVFSMSDIAFSESEINRLVECLKEIFVAFSNPGDVVGQLPVQTFPLSKSHLAAIQIDEKETAITGLFRMSEGTGLLSSIQVLMTLPIISGYKTLFESCLMLLEQMMNTKSGLLHLAFNSDSIIHIIHHLMKSSPNLDVETPGTAGHLGAKLAFHIQTVQSLDHIHSLLDSGVEEEEIEEELVHAFKTLFSLTYPSFGKYYVSRILGIGDFLKPVLTCIWYPCKFSDPDPVVESKVELEKKEPSDSEKIDDSNEKSAEPEVPEKKIEPAQHRTAINSYAAALFHMLLQKFEDVGYLYANLSDIARACLSEFHVTSRGDDMKKWLSPLEKQLDGTSADIKKLVGFIKDKISLLEWSSLTIDGPGICTALRLLNYICIKGDGEAQKTDAESRLRVLELFSVDALNVLLSLAQELHKSLHYFCHGIRAMAAGMAVTTHTMIVSVAQSLFSLLHQMLSHLMESSIDNKNLNSANITKVVVSLFSDLYILLRPVDSTLLHTLTGKAVALLSLFFTRSSCLSMSETILSEIIKFAEIQCDNFVPTLTLFSQLLPMPLPLITPVEAPDSAKVTALASCKLWSSCLAPHIDNLLSLLLPLSSSTCRPLIDVVIVIAQQIIDLSPALAMNLVKKFADDVSPLLVSTMIEDEDENTAVKSESAEVEKELMLSPEQITTIQTFSEILTLPAAKAAIISLLHNEGEGVMDLWTYASYTQTPTEDVAAVLLFMSVLVDVDLSLLPVKDDLQSLANSFPPTQHLRSIVNLAVAQLSSTCSVHARALLVLGQLLKVEFSFPYVYDALLKTDGLFYEKVNKICDSIDVSQPQCANAMFNLTEIFYLLMEPHIAAHTCLNKGQLKSILRYDKDTQQHPLKILVTKLEILVNDGACFDFDAGYTLDRLTSLIQSFNTIEDCNELIQLKMHDLPSPLSLVDQFSARPVFAIGDKDSNLYTQLSLTAPHISSQSVDHEDQRVVQCDLVATAEKFCPGFDLEEQLGKLAKAVDDQRVAEETEAMAKRRQKMETYSARLGKSLTFIKRSHGLLIAQQRAGRGRGRGRGRGNPSNRPFDLFRHRKQNTSRPPSMHVDDFVAADEEQQKIEEKDSFFKPPPPLPSVRRLPVPQSFKPREFISRVNRGRGTRNGGYRGRGGFSYQGANTNITPLNKFRPRPSSTGSRARGTDRFRGNSSSRSITSRLSFSPREGFKTNKQENTWGGFNREYMNGNSYRGRGSKLMKGGPRGGHSFSSSGNKPWGMSPFQRNRGRVYNKTRGKHIRSFTR